MFYPLNPYHEATIFEKPPNWLLVEKMFFGEMILVENFIGWGLWFLIIELVGGFIYCWGLWGWKMGKAYPN